MHRSDCAGLAVVAVSTELNARISPPITPTRHTVMKSLARRLGFENLELRRLLAAVNIPTDLTGQAGAEVATPVNIANGAGIRGAEIRVAFNPDVLTLDVEDITAGTAWDSTADPQVVANVDTTAGTAIIFISSANESPSGPGSLVLLGFRIRQTTATNTQVPIDLVEVRLNEGAIAVNPAPIAGPDPTDGLIVVTDATPGQSDRIAGIVFADTNGDNQPGPLEGIPGVRITLVNVATNATIETTTNDTGQYEFLNVPAGNYRIEQTQPTAYLDGGNNQLTVTLAVGQNLANQNFRELGLRAAFVFNRLATTSAQPVGSPAWINALRTINAAAEAQVNNAPQASSPQSFSLQDPVVAPQVASPFSVTTASSPSTPPAPPTPPAPTTTAMLGALDSGNGSFAGASGLPQTTTDDDEQQLLVDDAMSQIGLW